MKNLKSIKRDWRYKLARWLFNSWAKENPERTLLVQVAVTHKAAQLNGTETVLSNTKAMLGDHVEDRHA